MTTMKDVARLAGVSTSTVSHVINNNRFVSDSVRDKVLSAVKELNYAPSALARSLKLNQTRTIGMLVTTSNNPFLLKWFVALSATAMSVATALFYVIPKGMCLV